MKKNTGFMLIWFAALAVIGMSYEPAFGEFTPPGVRVVVEQAGDSARIIASWTPSVVGTEPISHYWLRLVKAGGENGSPLRSSQTPNTTDTIYYAWAPAGEMFRVGAQAEDSQGNTSACGTPPEPGCINDYMWSGAFELVAPFYPPGLPGSPDITIDTSRIFTLAELVVRPANLSLLEGFGSAILEGLYISVDSSLVACGKALLSENPLTVVGIGICDSGMWPVPVDSVYDPVHGDFTTPDELVASLRWRIVERLGFTRGTRTWSLDDV